LLNNLFVFHFLLCNVEMKPVKVLIADDEPDILEFTGRVLSHSGIEVIKAGNGKEAVELAMESNPDLIVLDVMMPVMTGYEASKIIRSEPRFDDCTIVFFSALSEALVRTAGVNIYYDAFIPKPVALHEFKRKILGFLSERGKI
jgi:two-component system alkaline phosphatase synthesis response regulator PhoP